METVGNMSLTRRLHTLFPTFSIVRVTLYKPALSYLCCGLDSVDSGVPSPKSHTQAPTSAEVLVNCIVDPTR